MAAGTGDTLKVIVAILKFILWIEQEANATQREPGEDWCGKNEIFQSCQLNIPTTPFPAGSFYTSPHAWKRKHGRSLTVMPWTTTDEFNVIPETQGMSLASFPVKFIPSHLRITVTWWRRMLVRRAEDRHSPRFQSYPGLESALKRIQAFSRRRCTMTAVKFRGVILHQRRMQRSTKHSVGEENSNTWTRWTPN